MQRNGQLCKFSFDLLMNYLHDDLFISFWSHVIATFVHCKGINFPFFSLFLNILQVDDPNKLGNLNIQCVYFKQTYLNPTEVSYKYCTFKQITTRNRELRVIEEKLNIGRLLTYFIHFQRRTQWKMLVNFN